MKKKFSVLQRAAALLAALCLLAGLALPVCAEGADDALSAQNVETIQQGNDPTVETLPDEQTDEDKTAPDGAAAATLTPAPTATPAFSPYRKVKEADGDAHCDPDGDTHRDPHPETDAHRDADTGRRGEQRKQRKICNLRGSQCSCGGRNNTPEGKLHNLFCTAYILD